MVRYRILLCRRADGLARPYGVAYRRGVAERSGEPVLLFVPYWRTQRRLDVADLSQLMAEHFPHASYPLEWSAIFECAPSVEGAEEFQPIEVMERAARQERARWWQHRLQRTVAELAARGADLPGYMVAFFQQLAHQVEPLAEAAVEVTLEAVSPWGRILFDPAQACVRSGQGQFAYAAGDFQIVRTRGRGISGTRGRPSQEFRGGGPRGLPDIASGRDRESTGESEQSQGDLTSPGLPNARIEVDAVRQVVTVEFAGSGSPPLLVLTPEDPALPAQARRADTTGGRMSARFEQVPAGSHLLCVFPSPDVGFPPGVQVHSVPSPGETPQPAGRTRPPAKRALLIGSPVGDLEGVEPDIDLMDGILSQYGFACRKCIGTEARRRGIVQALTELAQECTCDDAVVVYYSGHGGLAENPDYRPLHQGGTPQPRYHQFIVPVDIEDSTDSEFHGITNLELSKYLYELTEKTANVSVMLDCCYASGMCRGLPSATRSFRNRSLPEIWRRGIQPHLASLKSQGVTVDRLDISGNPKAVRLMATAPSQLAFEYSAADGGWLGLFTDSLVHLLDKVRGRPVSWEFLMRRIRQQIQEQQCSQRPEVEGPRRRLLFDVAEADSNGALEVKVHEGRVELVGGWIHGVEIGDRFSIVSAAQTLARGTRVAKALVERVSPAHCEVHLEDASDVASIPFGALAFPEERSLHRWSIRVTAVPATRDAAERFRAQLQEAAHLRVLEREDDEQALATVRIDPDAITLLNPANQPLVHPKPLAPSESEAFRETIENLRRFTQARSLASLESGQGEYRLNVPYELEWGQVIDGRPQMREKAGGELRVGDHIYVRLQNCGQQPLYVSFLDIGIAGRISLLNSDHPAGVEVAPAHEFVLGNANLGLELRGLPLTWNAGVPTDSGARLETIAVIISDAPHDLTPLESPGLRGALPKPPAGREPSELTLTLTQIAQGHCRGSTATRSPAELGYAVEHIDFFLHPPAAGAPGAFPGH